MPLAPDTLKRTRFASRYAVRHFVISAGVALLAAALVFLIWYPGPTATVLGVKRIYVVMLVVDVVCGPLLTSVLASPAKSRRELQLDLALVGLIQLTALGYGLHSLESARPIAYVFEQDRIVLVAKNDLYATDCRDRSQCMVTSTAWRGLKTYAIRTDQLERDRLRSLDLSLQGVSPAMRLSLWVPWDFRASQIHTALRPLTALHPLQREKLTALRGAAYVEQKDLRYLPLVSSKTLDWIAIFSIQGEWIEILPIDGF